MQMAKTLRMRNIRAELDEMLRRAFAQHQGAGTRVKPRELAAEVYERIDPDDVAPDLSAGAAEFYLIGRAGQICAAEHTVSEVVAEQVDLFEFKLQKLYPAERDDEKCYIPRDELTFEDRVLNIKRLEKEGERKIHHARVLRAETEHLVRAGKLDGDLAELDDVAVEAL
jgi:hypothetical protein